MVSDGADGPNRDDANFGFGLESESGSFPNVLLSFEAGVIGGGDDSPLLVTLVSSDPGTHG